MLDDRIGTWEAKVWLSVCDASLPMQPKAPLHLFKKAAEDTRFEALSVQWFVETDSSMPEHADRVPDVDGVFQYPLISEASANRIHCSRNCTLPKLASLMIRIRTYSVDTKSILATARRNSLTAGSICRFHHQIKKYEVVAQTVCLGHYYLMTADTRLIPKQLSAQPIPRPYPDCPRVHSIYCL